MAHGCDPPCTADWGRPPDAVVEAVFVNGCFAREGVDYAVLPDRLRFRSPLRVPPGASVLGTVLTALCAGVYPPGDEVDLVVRRAGRRQVVHATPLTA